MKQNNIRALISAAFCLLFLFPLPCLGQDAKGQVTAEVNRLKQLLPSLNFSAEEAQQNQEALKRVEDALQSGYLYSSLFRLQQLRPILMAYQYQRSKAEIEKRGVEAFDAEWKRLGKEIADKQKRPAADASARLPAAVKAMAEASLSQMGPYYQSGRLYGLNTTIGNGLFYLGAAAAHLDFALFCQGLGFGQPPHPPKLRPLDAELAGLEAEILQAYRQPGAAEQQRLFNQANSTLKVATELNNEKRFGGALLQYLEASRILGIITAAPEQAAPLKEQSEALRARLTSGAADHSLGLLYWEMAQSLLNQTDKESLKRAAVILQRVLPRYFEYMTEKNS